MFRAMNFVGEVYGGWLKLGLECWKVPIGMGYTLVSLYARTGIHLPWEDVLTKDILSENVFDLQA